jgi:hypothetical protein
MGQLKPLLSVGRCTAVETVVHYSLCSDIVRMNYDPQSKPPVPSAF